MPARNASEKIEPKTYFFARDRGQTGGRHGHRNRGLAVDGRPISAIDMMALADSIAITAMMATVRSMVSIARRATCSIIDHAMLARNSGHEQADS